MHRASATAEALLLHDAAGVYAYFLPVKKDYALYYRVFTSRVVTDPKGTVIMKAKSSV